MKKQSFFLTLLAGLLANLAFSTPIQAGFLTTVTLANDTGIAVNDLETTWIGTGGSITDVTVIAPPSSAVVAANTIDITFDAALAAGNAVSFSFLTAHAPLTFHSGTWSSTTSVGTKFPAPVDAVRDKLSVSTLAVVDEPGSMALMGIGMAALFAAHRLFNGRSPSWLKRFPR